MGHYSISHKKTLPRNFLLVLVGSVLQLIHLNASSLPMKLSFSFNILDETNSYSKQISAYPVSPKIRRNLKKKP